MKTIGLIGGMSYESTETYYHVINETVAKRLRGFHSAKCLMYSVDFSEVEDSMSRGDWNECARIMCDAAQSLERGGADFILICTNTVHKVADIVRESINIPMLHIADAAAEAMKARDIKCAALLGTRFTMRESFYRDRLALHGINVLVPSEADMDETDRIIFKELCHGEIKEESRQKLESIINGLAEKGADGALLACTELGLIVRDEGLMIPTFDTAIIHARAAANIAIVE